MKFTHIVRAFIGFASALAKPQKAAVEREILEIEARKEVGRPQLPYALAAAIIWAGVAYGLLAPAPPTHTSRTTLAMASCVP